MLTRTNRNRRPALVVGPVIAAMGIVFGDIGTSPLYAASTTFGTSGSQQSGPSPAYVLGSTAAIIYSLTLVVTVLYVRFLMRADNKGEGGLLALFGLLRRSKLKARNLAVFTIVAMIGALHAAGVNASSVVGASAVVSAVLALSLQTTLGNVIGGVALQLDGSIHVGDWIALENGRQGKVKEIHWRHTVLETRDWGTLIVPNSTLLSGQIIVLGKRDGQPKQYRYWIYFNVDFRYPPSRVIDVVNEALQQGSILNVAQDPKAHCIVMDFAKDNRDSFAYYAVRYWLTDLAVDDPTSSLVRQRIYMALKRASIPFARAANTTFLVGEEDNATRRVRHRGERLRAVEQMELVKMLTDSEREHLADHLVFAPFVRGEIVTRKGNVAHWLYILLSGTVNIQITDGGETRVLTSIEAPGFFGEMGMMTGEPRAADVVAKTDVECYRLDKDGFAEIMRARPEIAKEMSKTMATRRAELVAAKDGLADEQKAQFAKEEEKRILGRIEAFFGLAG